MKRWYKFVLIIVLLIYLVSIFSLIWPDTVKQLISLLDDINLADSTSGQTLITYLGLFILGLTVVILVGVIATPIQKGSILLVKSEKGILSLGNEGVNNFIQTQLSGEGLSNIRVGIKNTKRVKRFNIIADALYKEAVISDLPRLEKNLTNKLDNLLSGVNKAPIRVNISVNQANKRKHKASRVI